MLGVWSLRVMDEVDGEIRSSASKASSIARRLIYSSLYPPALSLVGMST